jgi:hypothetical protein
MITSLNLKLTPAFVLHAKVAKLGCTRSLQHFAGVSGVAVFRAFFFVSDRGRKGEILAILEILFWVRYALNGRLHGKGAIRCPKLCEKFAPIMVLAEDRKTWFLGSYFLSKETKSTKVATSAN